MGDFQGAIIFSPLLISGKKLSFQEVLDFLQDLQSESSDALTDDSSDEEIPANNLLKLSLDYEEDDQETKQDPGCSSSRLENTLFPTRGSSALKNIQSKPHSKCTTCNEFLCINERKNCFFEYHLFKFKCKTCFY
ncbi:hypothetical protein TNCV_135381 [Trichonephila clavipes]|nr:hypothetical protein TNCV_135381 [Trichonephila clavipes]